MAKLLIFNFDGTDNEPSDAKQDVDYKGAKEDDNISNIAKFQLMLGGHFKEEKNPDFYIVDNPNKVTDMHDDLVHHAFYYHGIGTYGSRIKRVMNAMVAMEKADVRTILNNAILHFNKA